MNPKLPIEVLEQRGRSHITKAEARERRETEVKPVDTSVQPPRWLTTKAQREEFVHIAGQLNELGVWDALDTDELARYVLVSEAHADVMKRLRRSIKADDLDLVKCYMANEKELYRQSHELASSLGLNVTSRARITLPRKPKDKGEVEF